MSARRSLKRKTATLSRGGCRASKAMQSVRHPSHQFSKGLVSNTNLATSPHSCLQDMVPKQSAAGFISPHSFSDHPGEPASSGVFQFEHVKTAWSASGALRRVMKGLGSSRANVEAHIALAPRIKFLNSARPMGGVGSGLCKCRHPTVFRPRKILATWRVFRLSSCKQTGERSGM